MLLSQIGELAMKLWQQIPEHFSNVQLAEFVIMPNHIHGLLTLLPDRACPVPTVGTNRYQNIGRKTLSAIVGSYKAAVSREAHRLDLTFVWQPRFYDRILRSRQEYINVAQYILDNPINWERDEFYE